MRINPLLKMKIRTGVRVFLECNRGKKYYAKDICHFLNTRLLNKTKVTTNQIGMYIKADKSNNSALLYPIKKEKTNRGYVYWID